MSPSPTSDTPDSPDSPDTPEAPRRGRPSRRQQRPRTPRLSPVGSVLDRSGLLIVDKPAGMTSHDVVAVLRGIMRTRKVGHSGTLDPMATGVLLVGVERGTKFLAHVVTHDKRYAATLRLGWATHTDDREGEITTVADPSAWDRLADAGIAEQLRAACASWTGEVMQRPTAVSSIKIDGKRAHELVRAGVEVDIPARPVTVHSLEITRIGEPATDEAGRRFLDVDIEVHCSSGTYIRALARDIGNDLGVGGHLVALRRRSVGPFAEEESATLEALQEAAEAARAAEGPQPDCHLSLDAAMQRCFPVREISAAEARLLADGRWLEPTGVREVQAAVLAPGTEEARGVALIKESGKRAAPVFLARPKGMD